MKNRIARAFVIGVALAVLAGCSGGGLEDIAPTSKKALRPLPQKIVTQMNAKGMKKSSPILMRIFKEENVLEVWKQKTNGEFDLIASYEICKWSGELGPKYIEGDRQAPEGFYTVTPAQMNPNSLYHLSFNLGYPNAYDRANGRTGSHLMVHGDCSSAGCYSMTDEQMEQIWAFARDAFEGGQTAFQVQAFPFRMTPENMARYKDDPNFEFWKMLKVGYDMFEITKQPPKVDVCEAKYQFNQIAAPGYSFNPAGPCPPMSLPESLAVQYAKHKAEQDKAFSRAVQLAWLTNKPRSETILGIEEARLVADWTRRRARGEKVASRPPSLPSPTAVASAKPAQTQQKDVAAVASAVPAPAAETPATSLPATAFVATLRKSETAPSAGAMPDFPAAAPDAAAAASPSVAVAVPTPDPRNQGGQEVAAAAEPKAQRRTLGALFSRIMGN